MGKYGEPRGQQQPSVWNGTSVKGLFGEEGKLLVDNDLGIGELTGIKPMWTTLRQGTGVVFDSRERRQERNGRKNSTSVEICNKSDLER